MIDKPQKGSGGLCRWSGDLTRNAGPFAAYRSSCHRQNVKIERLHDNQSSMRPSCKALAAWPAERHLKVLRALNHCNSYTSSNLKQKKNRHRLAKPGVIQAKSHVEWALKGTIMWNTSPVQAGLHRISGDGWGPACYSAHQAPPRLLMKLSFTLGRLM